jgi:uncharacterized protein (DUF934 family)
MRHILRQREWVEDNWRYLGEPAGEQDPLVVPFKEFRANLDRWRGYAGPLGVRVSPADKVEELAEDLARLGVVVVEFPTFSDGRGYSHGRVLRTRLKFDGELRATGVVKQDHIFFLARCGYDSFELAVDENVEEATRALQRFTVAYQPGAACVPIQRQRFFTRSG